VGGRDQRDAERPGCVGCVQRPGQWLAVMVSLMSSQTGQVNQRLVDAAADAERRASVSFGDAAQLRAPAVA